MNAGAGAYVKGDDFPLAKYARIVITPEVPTDDTGAAVEDFKIGTFDIMGYVNDYTITVSKTQASVTDEPAEQIAA